MNLSDQEFRRQWDAIKHKQGPLYIEEPRMDGHHLAHYVIHAIVALALVSIAAWLWSSPWALQ